MNIHRLAADILKAIFLLSDTLICREISYECVAQTAGDTGRHLHETWGLVYRTDLPSILDIKGAPCQDTI